MALTNTTLAADLAANDTIVKLTSTTGMPAVGAAASGGNDVRIQIGDEFMYHVQTIASGTIKVRSRGADGTVAVAHDILDNVSFGSPSDFPSYANGSEAPRALYTDEILNVGENGTIPVTNTTKDSIIYLTKATALATTTLAAPTQAQNGKKLVITSQTAAAHVITATALLADGAAGSPEDTATFAAEIGASMVLMASDGVWNVISLNGVTIS